MIQEKAKKIIDEASQNAVSDIYFQIHGERYGIFFKTPSSRSLQEYVDKTVGQALIAHFKFVAGMNVGEKRRVQLGSCWYDSSLGVRRIRLSCVGDFEGNESLVIRLLHEKNQPLKFWFNVEEKLKALPLGRGLHLFAGPVGSGKTSLMFDLALREFFGQEILTVEDPVELIHEAFVQLQVNEVIGNDYEELIKLSLRHRPDLLIVGEIRDKKTARAVLQASLTGYTVFSTVHASSISGVWSRLLELGILENELKNCLQTVFYQRLIEGKGVVEIAESGFKNWNNENWNKKMDQLFKAGHLSAQKSKREKIKSFQAG